MRRADIGDEGGSAVVDFVLSSFGLIAIFVTAAGIITNLYLRTVLTTAATDAARLMSRADVTRGCDQTDEPPASGASSVATAIERARQETQALIGDRLATHISAHTERVEGFCTTVVTVAATLPGLPLMNHVTNFEASAHATVELQ